ncbi:MAG: hypothetical protein GY838_12915 [bacterium]|nr:hypothetical protein [bacterium]
MADEQAPEPTAAADELAELEKLEARLAATKTRLATILQMLAEGKPLGGALVGQHGPWSAEAAQAFTELAEGHDAANGSLWEAIRAAGFDVIELPEALYGALAPDTK